MNLPVALKAPVEAEEYRRILFPYDGNIRHPSELAERMIPLEACQAIKLWLEAALVPASPDEARQLAALLVGGFTKQQVNDPDAFMWHLRTAFEKFPADMGAEVAQEVPATCKWLDIVTVNEALEAKAKKKRAALDHITLSIVYHERRTQQEAEEAEAAKGREEYRVWCEANPGKTMIDYAKEKTA